MAKKKIMKIIKSPPSRAVQILTPFRKIPRGAIFEIDKQFWVKIQNKIKNTDVGLAQRIDPYYHRDSTVSRFAGSCEVKYYETPSNPKKWAVCFIDDKVRVLQIGIQGVYKNKIVIVVENGCFISLDDNSDEWLFFTQSAAKKKAVRELIKKMKKIKFQVAYIQDNLSSVLRQLKRVVDIPVGSIKTTVSSQDLLG